MNVLILSSGTRNKVVRYFKEALDEDSRVIAADMSPLAPSLYEADVWYLVPRITDSTYIDTVLNICEREKVAGVLSLIDPELSLLAKNTGRFAEVGVRVIGSGFAECERALDKMQMFHWLTSHGYSCAKSYRDMNTFEQDLEAGLVQFPVFAKPSRGSASEAIGKIEDVSQLRDRFRREEHLMVQEFLDGQEIGVDAYVDLVSGEVVSIFAKRKIVMRAGETDKAISFKDGRLFDLIEKFLLESGFIGPIDIDVFDIDGEYLISEVNPRFGGGYPHAHECGCDHVTCVVNNLRGKACERQIGKYLENVAMMKYSEISILGVTENITSNFDAE